MLIARYIRGEAEGWGVVEEGFLLEAEGDPLASLELTGDRVPVEEVVLLPPCRPSKIVAVGLNYRDHAEELGMPLPDEPVLFMKPPSSLLRPGGKIIYPDCCRQVDYEAELALVVKDECRGVSPKDARGHILGYCCANDVTARDLQRKDVQWTRAKSFDTFCPLGPWLQTETEPDDLRIRLRLNGVLRQDSATSKMVFGPFELFSFISGVMTLCPGDVILTGTPPGVGEMRPGDEVEVEIESIGTLHNLVGLLAGNNE